jgi:F-type H+-transporting ATPase subunit epsilon
MAEAVAQSGGLDVHLVTPAAEIWAGAADYVVARSSAGDIGVLPGHEPVLSIMGVGPVTIRRTGQDDLIAACDGGFLSVSRPEEGGTRVDILAEHATVEVSVEKALEVSHNRAG